MRRILKDMASDSLLLEQGYLIVPWLSAESVEHLTQFFYRMHPVAGSGFYASAHTDQYEFKREINEQLIAHFQPCADVLFDDCRILGGTFVVKYPDGDNRIVPHQDWSITDEAEYLSYNIWVPLVDTDTDNGTLSVIPRSHRMPRHYRGLGIDDPYAALGDQLWSYLIPLSLKAGEAVVYDTRLIHASAQNVSGSARIAMLSGMVAAEAPMRYYHGRDGMIEEYAGNVDFYLHENILKGPGNLGLIKTIQPCQDAIDAKRFAELLDGLK